MGYESIDGVRDMCAEKYGRVTEQTYYNIYNNIKGFIRNNNPSLTPEEAEELASNCIGGIYYAGEQPGRLNDLGENENFAYKCMKAVAQIAHVRGKEVVWAPAVDVEVLGSYANTGLYNDGKYSYDLLDVVIGQPGVFFSKYENNDTPPIIYDLKNSTKKQKMCIRDRS